MTSYMTPDFHYKQCCHVEVRYELTQVEAQIKLHYGHTFTLTQKTTQYGADTLFDKAGTDTWPNAEANAKHDLRAGASQNKQERSSCSYQYKLSCPMQ